MVRILHTSDWHLGRHFGQASLLDDQEAFLAWMVELCRERGVDLLVVAGDVFDRAVAPPEALRPYTRTVQDLQRAGIRAAIIAGNHDGPERLDLYGGLLDPSGILVRGGYRNLGEVLHLEFADGPLDLVLLPFLDPQAAPDDLPDGVPAGGEGEAPPGDSAFHRRLRRTHQSVLQAAVEATRPRLRAPRSVAVAHAFVTGAATSDSERQLTVGGTGTVSAELFAPFSYTALGHLHRPQSVGGPRSVRYSGSPLAYSFSETDDKSVTLVEMAADGTCSVEALPVPVGRRVLTVEGTIDELLRAAPTLEQRERWVRAVLTDRGVVLDARQRLAAAYPFVVEIEQRAVGVAAPGVDGESVDRRTASVAELADTFWNESVGAAPTPEERDLLHEALAAAERALASGQDGSA